MPETHSSDNQILEELQKIRALLEPKPPAPAPPPPKGMRAEFLDFLSKYRVMGLAVAFIIGLYLGQVVQALVTDLIMPIISYATGAGGGVAWETLQVGPFLVGHFIGAIITFVIVALVIFLLVKVTKRWNI